jgi:nucleotide-binding universal stress UspA family protein
VSRSLPQETTTVNPIQSILVHLDNGPHGAARLQTARALGAQLGASVTALYAARPASVALSALFTVGLPSPELVALDEERLAAAHRLVDEVCAEPGVQIEWRAARDVPESEFMQQALYADLLVLGQHDRTYRDSGVAPDFVQRVVMESGKPALVVPCSDVTVQRPGFGTVLSAWKESREAARALSAAMPLLLRADAVHIALDSGVADAQRTLLLRFLHSHGVEAQVHAVAGPSAQVGAALRSLAATLNADLMVMGCYGHSRGRELVLGGATRTVLHEMTIPVLMAH